MTIDTIIRKTYSAGGQVIATRVSGDPVSANNGLFYFHSDHTSASPVEPLSTGLGSATFLTHGNGHVNEGDKVANSTKFYMPFGEYRIQLPSPTADITDDSSQTTFTGHKHNDYIKLIYMGARYFLPNTNRFLTPDPIVPDFSNPQSLNRYSYVLNRPLNLVDPSGNCYVSPEPGEPPICEPPTPPGAGGIPDPIFDYPCTPSGNNVCITPDDDPIDMITHVVYGEGGALSLQMAANVLQTLVNRAWNLWTCHSCGYNPDQIPWEEITSEQLTALLLFIASQPYTGEYGGQYPAYNAWSSAYERGKGYWNDIRTAVADLVNSAGQTAISVGGVTPYTAISSNRAVRFYAAGPMLMAPPGAVGYDEYTTPYYDGPITKEDRQLIVSIPWRQYYTTSAFDPADWVTPGYQQFWNIKLYWE